MYKQFYRRYIDDGFLFWQGTVEQLEQFVSFINSLHPTIKVTCSYDATEREVSFLDVLVRIENSRITTDLYTKPTSVVQYLLPSSCHPQHITKNIPYSLGYRLLAVLRICSNHSTLLLRLQELKTMLLDFNYEIKWIENAFTRVLQIDRNGPDTRE